MRRNVAVVQVAPGHERNPHGAKVLTGCGAYTGHLLCWSCAAFDLQEAFIFRGAQWQIVNRSSGVHSRQRLEAIHQLTAYPVERFGLGIELDAHRESGTGKAFLFALYEDIAAEHEPCRRQQHNRQRHLGYDQAVSGAQRAAHDSAAALAKERIDAHDRGR